MHFLLKIVIFQPAMLVSGRVVLSIVVSLLKRYHLRLLMSDPYGFANLPFVNPRPKKLSSPAPSKEPFLHGATNHHPLACPRKLPSLKLTHPLKINPWKRRFLLEYIIFSGENVSFRECSICGWWYPP